MFLDAGFKVVGTRTSSVEQASWLADVFMIDPLAVVDEDPVAFVSAASKLSPVLVLTSGRYPNVKAYGEAGALGLVDRNSETHVFITAVRSVMSGNRFTGDTPEPPLPDRTSAPAQTELSPREEQVLAQIAHGLTHSQIARKLGISRHTVDTYVKRIRAKIDAGNKAELTRAAILGQFSGSGSWPGRPVPRRAPVGERGRGDGHGEQSERGRQPGAPRASYGPLPCPTPYLPMTVSGLFW
ncbi:DNA-binding NarL/FixJ family response regulator [Actinocrispum wychmicini]|uniref:DNA-binding NarL/FixJ family response regulator n=1 Tax=Actinocrispum wychmicini TaxID=1213861 RepID=A0A4R2JBF6_9PSEU|nr:DNA-binding NarL/FixJ family response regulator [Actinocrispum wychmicini]